MVIEREKWEAKKESSSGWIGRLICLEKQKILHLIYKLPYDKNS